MLFSDPWHKITWDYICLEKNTFFLHDEKFAQKNQQQKFEIFFNDLVRVLLIPYQTQFGKELTKPLPNH